MGGTKALTRSVVRFVRVLAVFAIIAAVFVMHGLAGDHDLNSSSFAAGSSNASILAPAAAAAAPPTGVSPALRSGPPHAVVAPTTQRIDRLLAAAAGSVPVHGDDDAAHSCLAFLSACGIALAAFALCVRRRPPAGWTGRPVSTVRSRGVGALTSAGGARPPSLSSLCLSRT
jgi:hypothetical protein